MTNTRNKELLLDCILIGKVKCNGGMQDNNNDEKYVKEIKTLVRLFGESINREELRKKIVHYNGNVDLVIKDIVQQFVEKEVLKYKKKKKKTMCFSHSIDINPQK
ncbi:hypothetical protein RFI_25623 [Reticulomyxa filosa]|uniref:Uncharacterized protein n=1 Tax=Reticulomyxa filosa TaxID=46433 RepID=X6MCK9_RETFI|nr:hypothetical protein RFI_25623 [Reticulomyxa filosa]|eukprot:ETO11753.1 hypothetical protein RFI_25623 [Reticulomyxa filosa]